MAKKLITLEEMKEKLLKKLIDYDTIKNDPPRTGLTKCKLEDFEKDE